MLKETVTEIAGRRVVLMDSITSASEDDVDQIVISASHGGVSSGEFATRQRLGACFFNDAGVGKDDAGVAALKMLEDIGVPVSLSATTPPGSATHATTGSMASSPMSTRSRPRRACTKARPFMTPFARCRASAHGRRGFR